MLQSDWLRYSLSIRQQISSSGDFNATWPSFIKQCLFLVFSNNFEEITNTSLFLLKQIDY